MPFDLYSDVILTRDVQEHRLRAGDVETVVERHHVASVPEEGCSVEFFVMTGNTVALATVPASALRLPTRVPCVPSARRPKLGRPLDTDWRTSCRPPALRKARSIGLNPAGRPSSDAVTISFAAGIHPHGPPAAGPGWHSAPRWRQQYGRPASIRWSCSVMNTAH